MFLRCTLASLLLITSGTALLAAEGGQSRLQEVASFPDQQVTGIAVSKEGRIFVNFPYWSGDHKLSVAEVLKDGTIHPYPDEFWNRNEGNPRERFVCVQSVYVDPEDALWVLDPAAPMLDKVVENGPKLVKIDLASNKVVQTILFDKTVAPEKSYLNDIRIDQKSGHAFITESGVGSIVIVDLKSGQARRVLQDSPTTKAEPDKSLVVDGMKLIDPKTGTAPQFNADGIALDQDKGILYFHPLSARKLYKVKTSDLLNEKLSGEELASRVVTVGETAAPDGMILGKDGMVYLAAFEEDAIVRVDPGTGKSQTVIRDERLQWPDTMSWGPSGELYVTTSQIHRMPKFHAGQSARKEPYRVYMLSVP